MVFVIQRIKEEISLSRVMLISSYIKRAVLRDFSASFGLASHCSLCAKVGRAAEYHFLAVVWLGTWQRMLHQSIPPAHPSEETGTFHGRNSLSWPAALFKFYSLTEMKGGENQKSGISTMNGIDFSEDTFSLEKYLLSL